MLESVAGIIDETVAHAESSEEEVVVVVRSNSTASNNKVVNGGGSPMSRRRNARNSLNSSSYRKVIVKDAKVQPCMSWRRSNGWTRVTGQSKVS